MNAIDRIKLVAKYLAVWDQPAIISDKYSEPLPLAEAKKDKKAFPHQDETSRLSTVKEELPAKTEEVYKIEDGKAKKAQYTEVPVAPVTTEQEQNLGDWLRALDLQNVTTPEELDALKTEIDNKFAEFRDELIPAEELPQMEQEVDQAFQQMQGSKKITAEDLVSKIDMYIKEELKKLDEAELLAALSELIDQLPEKLNEIVNDEEFFQNQMVWPNQ